MQKTEAHIIILLQEKDKKAISMIYDKWAEPLFGMINNICKNEAISKDVLQDTFIKVWEKSESYDPKKAKLFTWIYQIARNKAIDAYRKISKSNTDEIHFADSIVSKVESDTHLYNSELNSKIKKLDNKYQEVLKGIYFQGMTHVEMSDQSGIPIGTIKSRLRIGLRKLREMYIETTSIITLLICLLYWN